MTASRFPEHSNLRSSAYGILLAATFAAPLAAQEPTTQELLKRIEAQDRRIEELSKPLQPNGTSASFNVPNKGGVPMTASYDKGFRLRSNDPSSPFELKVNGRMQWRIEGFSADKDKSVVNTDRTEFEIERARLEFASTFLDGNAHFYVNLDADTDDNHKVIFHDFWINYDVAKNHSIYVGKAFTGGSREWLTGSIGTHLVDRSLATTFFRPDRTLGVWAVGKMPGDIHYRMLIGNGLSTTDLSSGSVDQNFVYAGSFWKDLFGSFGKGFADLEHHEQVAMRIGTSLTYTRQDEGQGAANAEAGTVFIGRGMKLTDMGIDKYDYHLAAADAAVKYQGFSANAELYYRWLDNLETTAGPAARTSYYDWGGYCDVGYMIAKQTLEPVVRVSSVQGIDMPGLSGTSWEYAAGINYYVDGTHLNKLTVDLAKLDGSPVKNSAPGYRVNDNGWMFRLQWQIAF